MDSDVLDVSYSALLRQETIFKSLVSMTFAQLITWHTC